MSLKERVYQVLQAEFPRDRLSRLVRLSIAGLIVLNVVALIVETHLVAGDPVRRYLAGFDVMSVAIFTLEYALRLWSCTVSETYRHGLSGRLRFALAPLMIVDLIAILPFYVPLVVALDLRVARLLRLMRLLRVLKLGRFSRSLQLLGRILRRKGQDLASCVFIILVLLILASSLAYFAEHEAQPEQFPNITAALWWGMAALSTVGYGDVVPITDLGKVLGAIVALLGIGVFALPAGIIASGYVEELELRQSAPTEGAEQAPAAAPSVCPHCGERLA